jgi:hypothetical protein
MMIFMILAFVALAGFAILIAIPAMIIGGLFWLITLPFRLFFGILGMVFGLVFGAFGLFFGLVGAIFRVVFGIFGAILGLIFGPLLLLLLGVALVGGLIVGLFSLLAPLVPVILLALVGWGIYRISTNRPSPSSPSF